MLSAGLDRDLNVSLREIRLLRLSPSDDPEAPVQCRVEHVSLNDPNRPVYHALSYVWGDASKTETLQVDNTKVPVPVNLAAALQHARARDKEMLLWADAICINQANVEEKSAQVAMMASIFEEAISVIVWLGNASEDSSLAMATVEAWGAPELKGERYLLEKIRTDGFDASRWSALENLFSRPYWQRRWVFQEILLGHNVQVHCGSDIVGWDKFQGLEEAWYQVLRKVDGLLPLTVKQEDTIKDSKIRVLVPFTSSDKTDKWKKATRSMISMLQGTAGFKCSDPRDHLFAIMSLAKDADSFPPPDYSKSLLDVYSSFARAHIRATNSLDILGEAAIRLPGRDMTEESNLPSWIPDWRVEPIPKPLNRSPNIYNATNGQELPSDLINMLGTGGVALEDYRLRVRGIVVDKVALIHDEGVNNIAMMLWVLISGITTGADPVHPSGYPFLNVLFKTLLLDHDYRIRFGDISLTSEESDLPDMFFQMAEGFLLLVCLQWGYLRDVLFQEETSEQVLFDIDLRFLKEGSELAARFPKLETLKTFRDAVRKEGRESLELTLLIMKTIQEAIKKYIMSNRVLFETDRDLFGVSTHGLQKDDLVVVLEGCKAPLILREENKVFKLVGDAFIYGLMQGEAFDSDNSRLDLELPPAQEFILE